MKWLSGGVTFVNVAVVAALLIGMTTGGLSRTRAIISLGLGLIIAVLAWRQTRDPDAAPLSGSTESRPTRRRGDKGAAQAPVEPNPYRRVWFWLLACAFAFFAFRSFGWIVFIDGGNLKVQSPNNLGDLALHFTYIRNFASGVPLWPENPIHFSSNVRYPAGTDMFNALLELIRVDTIRGLVWAGMVGSLGTFYALYRWGGKFTVAGFLFNGGLAGFQLLQTWKWLDYQGENTIAWKSLPLSMLVTQRGLLYALPAGLLLLYHWRDKFFPAEDGRQTNGGRGHDAGRGGILPFWLELLLYASMPLFHMHTFIALSLMAALLFVICGGAVRRHLALVVGAAVVPATFIVWTITDHFQARSVLEWAPGWVRGTGEFKQGFFSFWLLNFGLTLPLMIALVAFLIYRNWPRGIAARAETEPDAESEVALPSTEHISAFLQRLRSSASLGFVLPAALLFLFACLVKTAPWEWDNIKLIIWAYLIALPFLWRDLIARWPVPVRVGVCVAIFFSGFASLFGGLAVRPGFGFADRAEVDGIGAAVRKLPKAARFAAHPTYNHPLLLQGRKVVLGYPGHLWTQGFDYTEPEKKLGALMRGEPGWRQHAKDLGVRYLFWGREEKTAYGKSTRPWEREARLVAGGPWGSIYDLEAAPVTLPVPRQ